MDESRQLSKKVFFLYPPSVIQEQLISLLIQAEFEVATINDHQKASALLLRYPSSVMFANIESVLKADQWEAYIRTLVEGRDKHDARVGILAYNDNKSTVERYLFDIGVQCGFVLLKLQFAESAKIILKTLEVNEARGDRQYVRVKCNSQKTSLNLGGNGRYIQGELLDVSSRGFACILPKRVEIGITLRDIQLKLWGILAKVSGKVAASRKHEDGRDLHVVMFDSGVDRMTIGKIYAFIQKSVQAEIDSQV